jgi:hypothetical protein
MDGPPHAVQDVLSALPGRPAVVHFLLIPREAIMRALVLLAVAAMASQSAIAQYLTDFETLAGSAAGTLLTGQDGYYLPPAVVNTDFQVFTYAGNTLGIPQNPGGGNQFIAGTGPAGSPLTFARAQRNMTYGIGVGRWTIGFDVLGTFTGTLPTAQNLGSVSVQPFPGGRSFIALATWTDPATAANWNVNYVWFDAAGTQLQESPGPSFQTLAIDRWYRWETDMSFDTNEILEVRLTDLTTNATVVHVPVGRYMFGGAAGSTTPTGFRFFAGGGVAGNTMAFDNARIYRASDRTLTQTTLATLGYPFGLRIDYPVAAAGNLHALLWSDPFPEVTLPVVPGLHFAGLLRINGSNFTANGYGVFGPTGSQSFSIFVPNDPLFLGKLLDIQSIDFDFAAATVHFSANEVQLVVGSGICEVNIATATTTSTTLGDNDLQSIRDSSIGAPVSQGIPPFSCLPIRYRGDEGFVEGYAGTFSATSHNSDIDSISSRRVGRRTANGAWQVITCPNGYDVALMRDRANGRQYSVLSYERATGTARVIPGTTWLDTSTTSATPAQQRFYLGVAEDGQWAALILQDSNTTTPFVPKVLAFRTDGLSPAIDITPAGTTASDQFFDGTLCFTNDFLFVTGTQGWFWTSATAPTTLVSMPMPNTTATNQPALWVYPFSWRVSRDGSTLYQPIGSNAAASRGEMDIVKITNNGGTPLAVNHTQFALSTGIAEFGYSAISPSNANNSSNGIKASVSPDGTKIAFLAATTTATGATAFPGLYVADGTPNPTLYTVPGATFYSEVAFINATTVLFFAGTAIAATDHVQSFHSLDVPTGTITQIGTATDHRTRGQFWSLNKNWWYFIRSRTASNLNNIVAVNCATGAVHDVTGSEFGGGGAVGTIRTGSFNTTADPWFALEMQLRRARVGDQAYFTARREVAGAFEDSNVFRFDIENGGTAVMLTNNVGTGAAAANVLSIESLMISPDGNHLAWGQRLGTATTASEDVFHLDLAANTLMQVSVSTPTGQTITDGSIFFTCASPRGLVWSIGTASTSVPVANARVEFSVLGYAAPLLLSPAPSGTRLYQVIGTND